MRIRLHFCCGFQAPTFLFVIVRLDVYTCSHQSWQLGIQGRRSRVHSPSTPWNLTSISGTHLSEPNHASLQSHGESYHPWLGGGCKCRCCAQTSSLRTEVDRMRSPSSEQCTGDRSIAAGCLRQCKVQTRREERGRMERRRLGFLANATFFCGFLLARRRGSAAV